MKNAKTQRQILWKKKNKIKYVSVNTRNIPKFLLKCGAVVIIVVFKRNA